MSLSALSRNPNLSVYSADSTAVPATTTSLERKRILQDWANVGLSADIMRPRRVDEVWGETSVPVSQQDDDWQQQSYCCR